MNKYILIIIASATLLFSCNKIDPQAGFVLKSESITFGDMIEATNTSSNAKDYTWYVNGVECGSDKDLRYQTTESPNADNWVVRLVAKNKKRESVKEKSVELKAARGRLTFYGYDYGSGGSATVVGVGTVYVSAQFPSDPIDCEAPFTKTFFLPVGTYTYTVSGDAPTTREIAITKDACIKIGL